MEYNLLRGIFGRVQALARGQWPPETLRKKNQPDNILSEKTSDNAAHEQDNQPHV